MTTESKIQIYEVNGTEEPGIDAPQLLVSNHWNRKEFVRIRVGEIEYTVVAADLKRAIDNAQNSHRF